MALRTPLAFDEARALIADYALELETIEPLPAHGTVNSNFRVRASGRNYFLRINEGKSDDDVEREAALVERLRAGGLPTPEPLRARDRSCFVRVRAKQATLFPWLDARDAQPRADRPETVRVVGRALALLHFAAREIPRAELPRNHYSLDELERRVRSFAGDARFFALAPRLFGELDRARARPALRSGCIHQDLFPDNLLVDDRGELVAVLDFEQATWGEQLYDLAVAVNEWCWNGARIDARAMDSVLDAYAQAGGPAELDRAAFVERAKLGAARFAITRITDVELREGVDPDLRARKDYRDYVRRLEFWLAS